MSYITEQERLMLRRFAEAVEDGNNTSGSVSGWLVRTVRKDPAQQDLTIRLGAVFDPEVVKSRSSELGLWDTGYITLANGVAVGGYANLALYQNGAYNFSGHFHVSGAISYNVAFVWAVADSRNPASVYAFAHQGRLHGTFESGSRDSDWGRSEVWPGLAAGWSHLEGGWSYRWSASVSADFGVFLDDIIKLVAAGRAVGEVIKFFV